MTRRHWLWALGGGFAVGLLLGFVNVALAHHAKSGWAYDAVCCGDTDCHEIPVDAVRIVDGGFEITITPDNHPLATKVHVFFKAMGDPDVRQSKDENYHACLWPNEDSLQCFYIPPFGS